MKERLSLILIAFTLLLIRCQKGDPGPTGPAGPDANQQYINGAFAGTVTGKKKDGSPLKETFNYTYASASQPEGYTQSSPPTLNLFRSENYESNLSALYMSLVAVNKGASNQNILLNANGYNYFYLAKEVSSTSLYSVSGRFIPMDFNVVIPIDTLKKSTYPLDFSFYFSTAGSTYSSVNNSGLNENGQYYYGFSSTDGSMVYFNQPYYGGSFYKIVNAAGNASFTSTTYGGLTLKNNSNGNLVFYSGTQDLSLTVPMKADTYSITNYKYDASTSMLSFNFTMRMGGYPFPNTTGHPLTVTGTFSGKVYDSIVNGRVGSN